MRRQVSGSAAVAIAVAALVSSMAGLGRAGTTVIERPAAHKHHTAAKKKPTKAAKQAPAKLVCEPLTVDLGTYCMDRPPQPIPPADVGQNNYFYASQVCTAAGGWLPSAAQLIGAAKVVPLESTIHDSSATATVVASTAAASGVSIPVPIQTPKLGRTPTMTGAA